MDDLIKGKNLSLSKNTGENKLRLSDDRVTVKNCPSFPITTLCRYSKLLPFRELPHYFDTDGGI